MYSLKEIYIQDNKYTSLDFRAFEQKANLTEIHLIGDNMFNCACDTTSWMAIASSNFNITFFGGVCETPAQLLNSSVTSLALYNGTLNCAQVFSYDCFRDHNCTVEQVCVDTHNSFRCECVGGLEEVVDENGIETCVDIDECSEIISCELFCTNTIGSFFCTCGNHYTLDDNGMNCTDIDECNVSSPLPCQQDGIEKEGLCINTEGGFNCICNSGFNLVTPTNCADIDECEVLAETDCNQTCINIQEDYECTCSTGFMFSLSATPVLRVGNSTTGNKGRPCVDVDECLTGTDTCEQNCSNTFGSFICSCNEGYNLINTTRCVNINECDLNSMLCDANRGMRCNDTIGSFECICLDNYVLTTRENIIICVPVVFSLSTGAKAGIGITVFVIVAVILAVVTILICLIWQRGRSRGAKLTKKGSKEEVFLRELKYELPEIIVESPGQQDASLANIYEVPGSPEKDSDLYTYRDTLNGEDVSQSKNDEENERVRAKENEIADWSTSVLLENEDLPVAEPTDSEDILV